MGEEVQKCGVSTHSQSPKSSSPKRSLNMKFLSKLAGTCATLAAIASAAPFSSEPFDSTLSRRQNQDVSSDNLTVDLGYEVYQGYFDSSVGLNSWKGLIYSPFDQYQS